MKTLSPNKMSEMDYKKISQAFIYPLKILIGFLLMFAFTVSMTSGQTLEDYLLIAAEKNPELQSQFRQYSASVERIAQAGALPDPEISMGFFIQRMETLMGNQKMDVSLMQMFPWFGMLKVQEEEAALMAKANYEIFRDAKNNLFFQVKESYYQLYLLEEKRKIATENKKILETMERLALVRFQGGNTSDVINIPAPSPSTPQKDTQANAMGMGAAMSQSSSSSMVQSSMGMPGMGGGGSSGKMTDILRIQIQLKEIENELILLEEDQKILNIQFNLLLNREPREEIVLPSELKDQGILLNQQALLDSVFHNNPMLTMWQIEGEAARKKGEMAKLEGRPMFGVGLNYMYYSSRAPMGSPGGAHGGGTDYMPGGMGGNMVMPMVSMTLPINRKKYKSMAKSSELMREYAAYQQESMGNELTLMLEQILKDIQTSERNKKLYQDQEKLLRQTLDLMITEYANATGSFEELLSVQQQLLDYRLKNVTNEVNRQIAFARLETLIGKI